MPLELRRRAAVAALALPAIALAACGAGDDATPPMTPPLVTAAATTVAATVAATVATTTAATAPGAAGGASATTAAAPASASDPAPGGPGTVPPGAGPAPGAPATTPGVATSPTSPASPTSGPAATTAAITTAAATSQAPGTCAGVDGVQTTPDGRHVLLRAEGIDTAAPTIYVVHGFTGTPTGIEKYAELTASGNDRGVAVAYPEGSATAYGGFGWDTGSSIFSTTGVDDIAALAQMTDAVIATGCVDPATIVFTGESNGGAIALLAACSDEIASRYAAFVLVNPALDPAVLDRCVQARADVPLLVVAGLLDETVPYDGGKATLLAQPEAFARIAELRGCASVGDAGQVGELAVRTVGHGCASCTELVTIDDGTHTWPGTSRGVGGLRPGTFDLNDRILAFTTAPDPGSCVSGAAPG